MKTEMTRRLEALAEIWRERYAEHGRCGERGKAAMILQMRDEMLCILSTADRAAEIDQIHADAAAPTPAQALEAEVASLRARVERLEASVVTTILSGHRAR